MVLKPLDLQALYIILCIKVALVTDCTCGSCSMLLDTRKHLTTGKIGHY